jgi:hypothetical protein
MGVGDTDNTLLLQLIVRVKYCIPIGSSVPVRQKEEGKEGEVMRGKKIMKGRKRDRE